VTEMAIGLELTLLHSSDGSRVVVIMPVSGCRVDSFPPIEFVDSIEHGDNILHRSCRLHVMNRIEYESPARREDLTPAQNLFPDFSRRSKGKNFLRIDPSPQKTSRSPTSPSIARYPFRSLSTALD